MWDRVLILKLMSMVVAIILSCWPMSTRILMMVLLLLVKLRTIFAHKRGGIVSAFFIGLTGWGRELTL